MIRKDYMDWTMEEFVEEYYQENLHENFDEYVLFKLIEDFMFRKANCIKHGADERRSKS